MEQSIREIEINGVVYVPKGEECVVQAFPTFDHAADAAKGLEGRGGDVRPAQLWSGEWVVTKGCEGAPDYGDGDLVVVRSRDAGVHAGRLLTMVGSTVQLAESYRIWRWRGAHTLTDVATTGIESAKQSGHTRVKGPIGTAARPMIIIGACEVLPCTVAAWETIKGAGWAE